MPERSDMPTVFAAPLREESSIRSGPDHRAQVRFPFSAAAEICELHSQTRLAGRCSDLSSGGCYIDALTPFAVGAVVKVRIERDLREFEAGAVVAYAHVSMGMGLAFTEIKHEHQDVLRSWIAELSGERPSGSAMSTPTAVIAQTGANANMRLVVHGLIAMLVRKQLITDDEAAGLLREMFR
jgi:hypothetical protein